MENNNSNPNPTSALAENINEAVNAVNQTAPSGPTEADHMAEMVKNPVFKKFVDELEAKKKAEEEADPYREVREHVMTRKVSDAEKIELVDLVKTISEKVNVKDPMIINGLMQDVLGPLFEKKHAMRDAIKETTELANRGFLMKKHGSVGWDMLSGFAEHMEENFHISREDVLSLPIEKFQRNFEAYKIKVQMKEAEEAKKRSSQIYAPKTRG